VSIDSMVESLRGRLRQFMADVRERRARENAAARGQRAGFVQKLKGAGLGVDGGRKAGGGVKRAAVKKPRWAADQPGFVQNILGLKRPRKIA
jgi:hypothetical protein